MERAVSLIIIIVVMTGLVFFFKEALTDMVTNVFSVFIEYRGKNLVGRF